MANHMKDVAKLLGVEIGEEFCIKEREEIFKISKTCIEYFSFSYGKWFSATPVILAKLLMVHILLKVNVHRRLNGRQDLISFTSLHVLPEKIYGSVENGMETKTIIIGFTTALSLRHPMRLLRWQRRC